MKKEGKLETRVNVKMIKKEREKEKERERESTFEKTTT